MTHKAFKIATVVSSMLFVLAVLLFVAGYFSNPWEHCLSLANDFHISVSGHGVDSRIVFFSDADNGPYRGSIIAIIDSEGDLHPPLERVEWFGDSWGIYYRYFQLTDWKQWTLMVTLWYPIAIFAILPSIGILRWFKSNVRHMNREK